MSQPSQLPDSQFLSLIGGSTSSDALNSQDFNTSSPDQLLLEAQSQEDEETASNLQFCINVAVLRRCWHFERGCRDLLPYPESYIRDVMEYMSSVDTFLMQEQERRCTFNRFEPTDIDNQPLEQYAFEAYDLELQRLKYLIASFHRTRIKKIESFPLYYQFNEEQNQKLSPAEKNFLTKYITLTQKLFGLCFSGLPGRYGREKLVYTSPYLSHTILMKSQLPIQNFYLNEQIRGLYANTVVVASYKDCLQWISEGSLDVI